MAEDRPSARVLALTPLLSWAALMVLLAATVTYALTPHAPFKAAVALGISTAKATLIALFFMRLIKAPPLVRLAALAGLFWLSFLFLFVFADYLTRAPL